MCLIRGLSPGSARCPPQHLINGYGPTETTIFADHLRSARDVRAATEHPDRAADREHADYMLDAQREPVPIGVAGELYIGGAGWRAAI